MGGCLGLPPHSDQRGCVALPPTHPPTHLSTCRPSTMLKNIVDEASVAHKNVVPLCPRDRLAMEGRLLLRLERWDDAATLFRNQVGGWVGR